MADSKNDILLIIRFSASIPDLRLPIPFPRSTSAATLSSLIRPHLPSTYSDCPLRYIYAGQLLQHDTSLSSLLRLEKKSPSPSPGPSSSPRQFYIHCSITPTVHLTPQDLALESQRAAQFLTTCTQSVPAYGTTSPETTHLDQEPEGFDRLLNAGFTATEIALLRSQFLAIQSHTHTPDTLPTGSAMRALEERWLDNDTQNTPVPTTDENVADAGDGALEDLLWGNLLGFFFALGSLVWLIREPGVWSRRRKIAVLTGIGVNVAFCVLKAGS